MNTNVGEMPLDIFSDYVSDILGGDWSWEYLVPLLNWQGYVIRVAFHHGLWYGNGCGFNNAENGLGWSGVCYLYGNGLMKYPMDSGDGTYVGNGYSHNLYEY
jgi:hypothetical protein